VISVLRVSHVRNVLKAISRIICNATQNVLAAQALPTKTAKPALQAFTKTATHVTTNAQLVNSEPKIQPTPPYLYVTTAKNHVKSVL
jgi:hypothetical protein